MTTDVSNTHARLRQDAEAHLKAGTVPVSCQQALGVDALTLLYRLSSDPASAGDALRLLHELQVHQVELDLQHCQSAANEQELAEDLARFQTLYEWAPFAYFIVDREGCILNANTAGAELSGVNVNELIGRRIESLLRAESRPALLTHLQKMGPDPWTVEVAMESTATAVRSLQIRARLSPDAGCILLACCECQRPSQA